MIIIADEQTVMCLSIGWSQLWVTVATNNGKEESVENNNRHSGIREISNAWRVKIMVNSGIKELDSTGMGLSSAMLGY